MHQSHEPHLRESPLDSLTSVLDEIDYGIVLCDEQGIASCNRSAREQLGLRGCPLGCTGGTLRAHDPNEDAKLRAAVHDALACGRRRILGLRGGERPMSVAVVPLGASRPAPLALVVMGRSRLCSQLTESWFCALHQLTPAESSVLGDLLEGREPRSIALRNGVALSTVRSQIASIKSKTEVHAIRDLVMAAATLPPMAPIVYATA